MVVPFSKFYGKIYVGFVLKTKFLQGFHFKVNRNIIGSSKKQYSKQPSFGDIVMFYVTISENFERFQYFNFEPDFLENKSFSKNWSIVVLDENIYIKNASFPYKTVISEANPKTNKIMSTKWTCYKERSFTSNYFICFKFLFQFKNLWCRVDLLYQQSKCPYSYFL